MGVEQRLSDVLSEFARTLATDFPIQSILDHLLGRIVEILPITAAGVTLISPGTVPRYIAASDESALHFERLQAELGEGPCLTAFSSGEAVTIPDLRTDRRFATFSPRAVDEGFLAVFTFPLHHGEDRLGALDLYCSSPGPLEHEHLVTAQTLADVTTAYLLNAQARVALREASERAHERSMHDALTGLPNRSLLVQRLDHAVLRGRRSRKVVAILFADLDRFKAVNDTYGHHVGDQLLVAVGERLTAQLRPGDTLARFAGDEFVVLCEDLEEPAQVGPLADRIAAALAEPFLLPDAVVTISASVGIAFTGRGEAVPEQVLQDADTAMYEAKRRGGGGHAVMDLREQDRANRRAQLKHDLHGAVDRGELRLEYQPIVSVDAGRIDGLEALVRWQHPTFGLVAPEALIPLAEQTGLIAEVGHWVLDRACRDVLEWRRHRPGLGASVNVSSHQLLSPDFAAMVATVLADTGTDPALLTLDITASVFDEDAERSLVVLSDVKALGVKVALDDFGGDTSSLGHLRRFAVDAVKLDTGLVAQLGIGMADRLVAGAIVELAHGLGMAVVAEGVESRVQHDEVVSLRCDAYQGHHFSRPVAGAAVADLFRDPAPAGLHLRGAEPA